MKLSILLCIVVVPAAVLAVRSVMTISGDPHTKSYDGVLADYQASGVFVLQQPIDPTINDMKIQGYYQQCNPAASLPVACLRQIAVELFAGESSVRIQVGGSAAQPAYPAKPPRFPTPTPAQPAVEDPIVVTGADLRGYGNCAYDGTKSTCTRTTLGQAVVPFLDGRYTLAWDSKTRRVRINEVPTRGVTEGISIEYATYWMNVYVPNDRFLGKTNGLNAGLFNGLCSDDFTGRNGTLFYGDNVGSMKCGVRINNAQTYNWGDTWRVTNQSDSLFVSYAAHPIFQHVHVLDLPSGTQPDAATQTSLNGVPFTTVEQADLADQFCKNLASDNAQTKLNCLYDVAMIGDVNAAGALELAQTNAVSKEAADTTVAADTGTDSSSGGLSDGSKAAIVVGAFAGVALIVAGVLFFKLQRTKQDLSRALVLAQTNGGASSSRGAESDQAHIQLSENL